jgi:hypothetical protein
LSDQRCADLAAELGRLETVKLTRLGELLRFDAGSAPMGTSDDAEDRAMNNSFAKLA